MTRLESYVEQYARLTPDKIAIACSGQSITYLDLYNEILSRAADIKRIEANALIIRASQSIDFIISYLAAHIAGKPIVPLECDIPDSSLSKIAATVHSSYIPDHIADILFTTGTTGNQKGTMLSHTAIMANAENLIDAQKFSSDLTFIICGPLNHIGSLSKIWPSLAVGASILVLDGMKDLNALFDAIRNSKTKVATFMVPASIRMMLQFGKRELSTLAPKIDFIETGAAPMAQSDMENLCKILPNARLYNTYASTETGIIATHNYNDGYCMAGCLGKIMKHSQLHIDPDGLIYCSGKTIMSGYVGDDELTKSVLRNQAIYTQDLGRMDSESRLHLTGRQGDILNIGGYKINPVEVENVAKSYPDIRDCICIESPHPLLGNSLTLLVVPADHTDFDKKSFGSYLSSKLEGHKIPQILRIVESIKRTYNGKLDRKAYK